MSKRNKDRYVTFVELTDSIASSLNANPKIIRALVDYVFESIFDKLLNGKIVYFGYGRFMIKCDKNGRFRMYVKLNQRAKKLLYR